MPFESPCAANSVLTAEITEVYLIRGRLKKKQYDFFAATVSTVVEVDACKQEVV